jgi:hypothetical protein
MAAPTDEELRTIEGLRLLKAFSRIDDQAARKAILTLLETRSAIEPKARRTRPRPLKLVK